MATRFTNKICRASATTAKMIKWVIILSFCFLIGNIVWPYLGDWRFYFVPLALLLVAFNYFVYKSDLGKYEKVFMHYFLLLSYGNVVKMIFLNNAIVSQVNDFVWGGILSLILIVRLWVTYRRGRKLSKQ